MKLSVFLSGEIHSDWRDYIIQACAAADLPRVGIMRRHSHRVTV